nr:pyroglutamyl-peptidase I [Pseudomonas typographi]
MAAFEPFNGEALNPSWEAIKTLQGYTAIPGLRIACQPLPCVFERALQVLEHALAALRPSVVIVVGQAGGRPDITLERVAINLDDAPMVDNAGQQPIDTPVIDGAPAAYFTTLPVKAIAQALHENGIPASLSYSAGSYVCNHVFYGLMHVLRHRPRVRAGFVHVPYTPAQAAYYPGAPSMATTQVADAMVITVKAALDDLQHLPLPTGASH